MGPDRDGALIKEAGRLLDQGNELITERDRRIAELEAALMGLLAALDPPDISHESDLGPAKQRARALLEKR